MAPNYLKCDCAEDFCMTLRDNNLAPNERLPPTDARYSMRAVLLAMSLLALTATIAGFVLRRLPDSVQFPSVVTLIVVAALLVACFAHVARRRRRLERQAGMPRFVFVPHSYLFPKLPHLVTRVAAVGMLFFGILGLLMMGVSIWMMPLRQGAAWRVLNVFGAIFWFSFGISALWWHRGTHLCDAGVLMHNKFVPWDRYHRCYWDACHRDVLVLETWTAFRVPAELREQVEAFVRERIAAAKSAAIRSGPSEAAAT
jgi:hypothetical protein